MHWTNFNKLGGWKVGNKNPASAQVGFHCKSINKNPASSTGGQHQRSVGGRRQSFRCSSLLDCSSPLYYTCHCTAPRSSQRQMLGEHRFRRSNSRADTTMQWYGSYSCAAHRIYYYNLRQCCIHAQWVHCSGAKRMWGWSLTNQHQKYCLSQIKRARHQFTLQWFLFHCQF